MLSEETSVSFSTSYKDVMSEYNQVHIQKTVNEMKKVQISQKTPKPFHRSIELRTISKPNVPITLYNENTIVIKERLETHF